MAQYTSSIARVILLVDDTANQINHFITHSKHNDIARVRDISRDCQHVRQELHNIDESLRHQRIRVHDDSRTAFVARIVGIEMCFDKAKKEISKLNRLFPGEQPLPLSARLVRFMIEMRPMCCINTYDARVEALAKDISDAKAAFSQLSNFVGLSDQIRPVPEDVGRVGYNVNAVAIPLPKGVDHVGTVHSVASKLSLKVRGPADVVPFQKDLESEVHVPSDNLKRKFKDPALLPGIVDLDFGKREESVTTKGEKHPPIGEDETSDGLPAQVIPRPGPLRDKFSPKFEVPRLSPHILLDFGSSEKGEPVTAEGKLKRRLMTMDRTRERMATTGEILNAHGRQGVGKTSSLIGLGWDPEVREAFKEGGIYFISVGRNAHPAHVTKELARLVLASGGEKSAKDIREAGDLRAVIRITVKFFKGRRTLFLCDDIWQTDDSATDYLAELKELLATHRLSGIVVSTCSRHIASAGGIPVAFAPHPPKGDRSLAVFFSNSHGKISGQVVTKLPKKCRHAVNQVLSRCAGVPLALAIAGKAVLMITEYEGYPWHQAVVRYARELERSSSNVNTKNIDVYPNFVPTVRVSLQIADRWTKKRELRSPDGEVLRCSQLLTAMAVLRPQIQVSYAMLRKLWRLPEGNLVHEVVGILTDLNLITTSRGKEREHMVGLHDLMLEHCQLQAGNFLTKYHCDLLDEYFQSESDVMTCESINSADCAGMQPRNGKVFIRTWWSAARDGYIHENVCRHLAAGGCIAELVALLLHGRWTEFRTAYDGLLTWEGDFQHAFDALEKMSAPGGFKLNKKDVFEGLRFVRDAVRDSWVLITRNPRELAFQMHARLCDVDPQVWPVICYLESTRAIANKPWLKPMRRYWSLPGRAFSVEIFREGPVSSISVTNDMVFAALAVGCDVLVCNMENRTILQRLHGHNCQVESVAITHSGTRVASVSKDGTVLLWNRKGTISYRGPTELSKEMPFTCVTMTNDGLLVVAGARDGSLKFWDGESGNTVMEIRQHDGPVTAVAVSENGLHIASSSEDGTVRLWDGVSGNLRCTPLHHDDSVVTCVAISTDGSCVVSGSQDNTVRLWKGEGGTLLCELLCGHAAWVKCVAMTPDGSRVVSGAEDNTLRVWDARSKKVVSVLCEHEGGISAAAIDADGSRIVSGSRDNSVRLWSLEKEATATERVQGHRDSVMCVAMSSDGSRIASGSKDKTICLWNGETGEAACDLLSGHEGRVTCVAICANGSYVISGSEDMTVRLWDWERRQKIGDPLRGHDDVVSCVAVSDDGRQAVSGSRDRTLRLWDLRGTEVTSVPLHGHKDWVNCVAISADGTTFVSGSRDRTIRLWKASSRSTVGSPVTCNAYGVWMHDGLVCARHRYFGEGQVGAKCWQLDEEQGLLRCDKGYCSATAREGYGKEGEVEGTSWRIWRSEQDIVESGSTSDDDKLSILPASLGNNLAEQYSFIACAKQRVIGGRPMCNDGYVLATLPAGLGMSMVEQDAWFFQPSRDGRGGVVVVGLRNGMVCILELVVV